MAMSKTTQALRAQPYLRCYFPTENGAWVSYCVELDCCSMGYSVADATANLEAAMDLWFSSMLGRGQTIPAPMNLSSEQLSSDADGIFASYRKETK